MYCRPYLANLLKTFYVLQNILLCCRVLENDSTSRITVLEREVETLKNELKSLKRKFKTMMEGAAGGPGDINPLSPRVASPILVPFSPASPPVVRQVVAASPLPVGLTQTALLAAVDHLGQDNGRLVIKELVQRVFSTRELEEHSITGKRSAKSGEIVRPALDQVRLEILEAVCRLKCPALIHKTFVEVLQNLQKVSRSRTMKNTPNKE